MFIYSRRRFFEIIDELVTSLLADLADFGLSATFVTHDTAVLRLRSRSINGVPHLFVC